MKNFSKLSGLIAVAVTFFGMQSVASAAWAPIFTVQPPANGAYPASARIRTSRIKVEKVGMGCADTRMNFAGEGRDQNNFPIMLGLQLQGETAKGAMIYNVQPMATTVYVFHLQTAAVGTGGCVYNFYAHVIDDLE